MSCQNNYLIYPQRWDKFTQRKLQFRKWQLIRSSSTSTKRAEANTLGKKQMSLMIFLMFATPFIQRLADRRSLCWFLPTDTTTKLDCSGGSTMNFMSLAARFGKHPIIKFVGVLPLSLNSQN